MSFWDSVIAFWRSIKDSDVRAWIAFILVLAYVIAVMTFGILNSSSLESIVTALGPMVATIVGWYFGTRTRTESNTEKKVAPTQA